MSYDVLVEISDDLDAELRDRLVSLAYAASRSGPIGLVLRGVPPGEVDRRLDPVVRSQPMQTGGVRYLAVEDAKAILAENGAPGTVVVTRDAEWIPVARGAPARVVSPENGVAMLERRESAVGDPA